MSSRARVRVVVLLLFTAGVFAFARHPRLAPGRQAALWDAVVNEALVYRVGRDGWVTDLPSYLTENGMTPARSIPHMPSHTGERSSWDLPRCAPVGAGGYQPNEASALWAASRAAFTGLSATVIFSCSLSVAS